MKDKYVFILLVMVLLAGCGKKTVEPEYLQETIVESEKQDLQSVIGEESGETVSMEAEIVPEENEELIENNEPKKSEEAEGYETSEETKQDEGKEEMTELEIRGNEPIMMQVEYNCQTKFEDGLTFALLSEKAEQGGYAENVILWVNDETYDLSAEGSCYYGYVMRRPDEKIFLLLCMDWASDDYHTLVVDITDGKIVLCDDYEGASFEVLPEEYEAVNIHKRLAVLGYRDSDMRCTLTAEGKLVNSGEVYAISEKFTIINYELPVVIEETESVLAVGTKIQVTGTNGKDIVYFTVLETGQSGEFYLEVDEENFWAEPKINGIPEYEYFWSDKYDGQLIYAG